MRSAVLSSLRVLRRVAVGAVVVATWALTSTMAMAQVSGDCPTGVVTTTTGPVCGQVVALDGVGEVQAFLGIPYAEAPVVDLRWRAPVPRPPWDAPWAASAFGSRCPQNPGLEAATTTGVDEDCLCVNVWTPRRDGVGRPVLVFIHGGAFVTRSSAAELMAGGPYLYDGSRFAATQDVVVVSLNYRIGALGFLAGIGDLTGNDGLLDQQLALAWVRENAHAFGGDATRIALAGESAGAISVATHLIAMPSSTNLFQSAISSQRSCRATRRVCRSRTWGRPARSCVRTPSPRAAEWPRTRSRACERRASSGSWRHKPVA